MRGVHMADTSIYQNIIDPDDWGSCAEETKQYTAVVKRERYLEQIRPFMDTPIVKVLTGVRRSGKSVLLRLLEQELYERGVSSNQVLYLNFESVVNMKYHDFNLLVEKVKKFAAGQKDSRIYLFFDEIQNVGNWELCINSFRVDHDADIYITGSNAQLLSGELATHLSGRYVQFTVYPFSFSEFVDLYQSIDPSATIENCFRRYLDVGGMPVLKDVGFQPAPSRKYLRDIYDTIMIKDVIARNRIRDVDLLNRIILFLLANIGQTFSANAISRYFKNERRVVAVETILNYLKAATDAFLLYKIPRFDLIGKELLSVQEKYFIADHGLRQSVYGQGQRDINQVLENLVCLELLRRGYSVYVGKIGTLEVDFVAQRQDEKLYVQVCYLLAEPATIEREFGVLSRIPDNYPKYVVSMDEVNLSRDGIRHMHIRDFLLVDTY